MRNLVLIAVVLIVATSAACAVEPTTPSAEPDATAPQMITVDVKLVEISRKKMRELGVEFTTIDGQQSHKVEGELAVQQMPSVASVGLVEALVKNRVARTIAEPRIAATSGREARLSVGSQSEHSDAEAGSNESLGIEMRMTPTLLADGRVEVELSLKYSWQEKDNDESATANRVRHFSLDTGVVSKPREASVFSGLVLEDSDDSYLLIVTPEVVESTAAAQPAVTK